MCSKKREILCLVRTKKGKPLCVATPAAGRSAAAAPSPFSTSSEGWKATPAGEPDVEQLRAEPDLGTRGGPRTMIDVPHLEKKLQTGWRRGMCGRRARFSIHSKQ